MLSCWLKTSNMMFDFDFYSTFYYIRISCRHNCDKTTLRNYGVTSDLCFEVLDMHQPTCNAQVTPKMSSVMSVPVKLSVRQLEILKSHLNLCTINAEGFTSFYSKPLASCQKHQKSCLTQS